MHAPGTLSLHVAIHCCHMPSKAHEDLVQSGKWSRADQKVKGEMTGEE